MSPKWAKSSDMLAVRRVMFSLVQKQKHPERVRSILFYFKNIQQNPSMRYTNLIKHDLEVNQSFVLFWQKLKAKVFRVWSSSGRVDGAAGDGGDDLSGLGRWGLVFHVQHTKSTDFWFSPCVSWNSSSASFVLVRT